MTIEEQTVLIVDDAAADRLTCRRLLEQDQIHRYRCLEADSAAQALALLAETRPDCVLLDYLLPDAHGLALLDQINSTMGRDALAVILLTGRNDAALAVEAVRRGAHDCLDKNQIVPESLRRSVSSAIEKAALQRSLRESEERYRQLVEHSPTAIMINRGGRIAYINQVGLRLFGAERPELLLGKTPFELFHPDVHDLVRSRIERVLSGEAVPLAEERIVRLDGQVVDVEVSASPFIEQGRTSIHVVLRDITWRKQTEQQRRESEEKFRATFNQAAVGIAHVAPDGSWLLVNDALCRITGYSRDELLRLSFQQITHPDDLDSDVAYVQQMLEGKLQIYSLEKRYLRPDGSPVWINLTVSLVRDEAGAPQYFISVIEDIQERKRAEEQARRWQRVFEQAEFGLAHADAHTNTFLEVNQSFAGQRGYEPEDLVGQPFLSVYAPETHAEMQRIIAEIDRTGHLVYESVHQRRDGTRFPVMMEVTVIRDEDGRPFSRVAYALDITERRRIEQEREQLLLREQQARSIAETASRLKDDFLATLSHELRTPLNHIYGWVKLLRGGRLPETEIPRALETIERNVQAQNKLIEDLLDVSRIITGQMRLDVRSVALAEVVTSAVEASRAAAEAKGVRLQMIVDPRSSTISGDPNRLQQIVWNLISNAIKFTPRGGRVVVRVERINSFVRLIVSDTGEGIDHEFLPHVFDRFSQQDNTRTRKYGGLGLGLAIVRHLAELHGGRVSVESPGPGQGTTFTVELPLAVMHSLNYQPADRHPDQPVADTSLGSLPRLDGLRVLAVDDEPDSLVLLSALLTPLGAEVRTATGMAQALEITKAWRPGVLVSDIGMPDGDGYDLLQRMRELPGQSARTLPAVALTAYASASDRLRALAAGFQMHVTKPVEPAELVTVIASLTGRLGAGSKVRG
ncbi:MAG: PAS domain S-box protein [Blastocatellia bacterium]